MRLYFLRHGVAEQRGKWTGPDEARPLTKEGIDRMITQAERMAKLGLRPDLIVTSPFARAAQTAQIVAERLERTESLVSDDRLASGFDLRAFSRVLKDHSTAPTVMLVGHEPDFSQVIGQLVGGARMVLKKGGLACVEVYGGSLVSGELLWLATPQLLIG
jgi:phosphohistidine phosphatase